ncbi:MAG TPA: hypothetical protein VGQ33_03555 [Vicinamibacteria bacterium]|nr:hypothetical protein [Vicinamibacteria bacterium]
MEAPAEGTDARVSFWTTFRRVAVVIANLTALVVGVRELGLLLHDAQSLASRAALLKAVFWLTLKVTLASLLNCVVLGLPIAGLIYYVRFLARER